MWKEKIRANITKVEDMEKTTDSLFNRLNADDAEKESLTGELKSVVAAYEAMKQVRESRKGFFGWFWRFFNGDQNAKEVQYCEKLKEQVEALEKKDYDVGSAVFELQDKNILGKDADPNKLYRTHGANFTKSDIKGTLDIENAPDNKRYIDIEANKELADQINQDINKNEVKEISEVQTEEKKIEVPQIDALN